MYRIPALFFLLIVLLVGCDKNSGQEPKSLPQQDFLVASPPPPAPAASSAIVQRFIPSNDVRGAALDTSTGRLCKTYAWKDDHNRPQGLPLCSELDSDIGHIGDRRAFLGYEYTFDGRTWVRGNTTQSYNPKTRTFTPKSDDPFDPLGILTIEEKRQRRLGRKKIQAVADQFHVSEEEVVKYAKEAGYSVAE